MKVTAFNGGKIANAGTNTSYRIIKPNLYKKWDKGTFGSVAASVEYHYSKHRNERFVKAKNIESYLNKTNKMYSKVRKLKKSTKDFRLIAKPGNPKKKHVASYKFIDRSKNSTRKQYITISQSKQKKILTFGGN